MATVAPSCANRIANARDLAIGRAQRQFDLAFADDRLQPRGHSFPKLEDAAVRMPS
jgi:hypothetical protein